MIVLAINCGSSSLKFQAIDFQNKEKDVLTQLPQKGYIKQNFYPEKIHQKQNKQFLVGKKHKKWAYGQE